MTTLPQIRHFKGANAPTNPAVADAVYFIKGDSDASFEVYVTDANGQPFPANVNDAVLSAAVGSAVSALLPRTRLVASRTYYVRTDGDDGNNGLTNSAGGAFLTIQAAINAVSLLDLGGFDVTIQIVDGTYVSSQLVLKSPVGAGNIIIQGNASTPGNVIVSSSGNGIQGVGIKSPYRILGLTLQTSSSSAYAFDLDAGTLLYFGKIKFATGSNPWRAHFRIAGGAKASDIGGFNAYEIADGPAWYHVYCINGGFFQLVNTTTVTITGAPDWGFAFARADTLAGMLISSSTVFSGSSTGVRYSAVGNGVVNVQAAGAEFLPGDEAGSTATGGQYL